jgi:hypothetical protein
MENYNNWEQKAEEALNSLDGIQRAVANPFLYTRVIARIDEQKNSWSNIINFISRPVIAISATAIFIGINALVVFRHPQVQQMSKSTSTESEQAFESEYATVNYTLAEANNNDK